VISEIGASNFKGQSFRQALAPVTVIVGDNFRGKSSRVEALVLACAGYLPGVDRRPRDAYDRLSSGLTMEVWASGGGFSVRRRWALVGGAVRYSDQVEPAGWLLPPVVADAREYLGLSAPQRAAFLSRAAPEPAGCDAASAERRVAAAAKAADLGAGERGERTLGSVVAALCALKDGCWTAGGECLGPADSPLERDDQASLQALSGAQEWLAAAASYLKKRKNAAAAAAQRAEKAQAEMAAHSAAAGAQFPDCGAEQARADAQAARDRACCAAAEAEAQASSAARALAAAQAAASRLAAAAGARAAAQAAAASLAEVESQEPRDPGDGSSLLLAAAVAAERLKWADAEESRLKAAAGAASAPRPQPGKCPECGRKFTPAQRAAAAAKAERQAEAARAAWQAAVEAYNAAAEADKEARESLARWRSAADLRRAWGEEHMRLVKLASAPPSSDADAALAADCERLEAEAAARRAAADEAAARARASGEALAAADAAYRKLLAHRAAAASKAKAAENGAEARAEAEACKAAAAEVAKVQADLTSQTVGSLVARANELCADALGAELAFVGGDVCLLRSGRPVRCQRPDCSGSEEALAQCALSVALAAGSPVRIVLLDEVGRLHKARRERLIERLAKLQDAGRVDQAVLVDTERPSGPARSNVEVVEL